MEKYLDADAYEKNEEVKLPYKKKEIDRRDSQS